MSTPAKPHRYTFCLLDTTHLTLVTTWLDAPHMRETWDNSPAHREDIRCFAHGRKEPSSYFGGIFTYWIGHVDGTPHALILTARVKHDDDLPPLWKENLQEDTPTFSIDFGIGEASLLGQGHACPTLTAFMNFFAVHHTVGAFFIDPSTRNPKASHVYGKAGFEVVGTFQPNSGAFLGDETHLMIKRL